MGRRYNAKLITLGIVKVAAFIISIKLLRQLVFIPLGAISTKYWSQYDGRGLNEPWYLSSSITILLVTIFVCLVFIKFIDKKDWSYIRLLSANKLNFFFIGSLLSFVMASVFIAVTILSGAIELNFEPKSLSSILFYLLLASIGTFALILSEELIARGYILKTFEIHFNAISAVIVSSFLFSVFHLFRPNISLIGFLNIFLMGCVLSLICIYYKSLWLPIGLHFGWNFFLYFYNLPISGHQYPHQIFSLKYNEHSLLSGTKFGPEDSVFITLLLIIFVAYIFMRFKKKIILYEN